MIPDIDIYDVFRLPKDSQFKGAVFFTYSLDGDIVTNGLMKLFGINSRRKLRECEYFKIFAHFSAIQNCKGLLYGQVYRKIPEKHTSFHPKLYILKYQKDKRILFRIITGSFNLTPSGLCGNREVVFYKDVIAKRSSSGNVYEFCHKMGVNKDFLTGISDGGIEFIFQSPGSNSTFIKALNKLVLKSTKKVHIISPFWNSTFIKTIAEDLKLPINIYCNEEEQCALAL